MNALLRRSLAFSAALTLTTVGLAQSAGDTLISAGSGWRYNDTGTNLGTGWRNPDYADQGWAVGPAEFGYGDGGEATLLNYGPNSNNKYPCYYFRRTFSVADPTRYDTLSLDVLRDDGCVVYLNGQEVARLGMPSGTITYATYASSAAEYDWDRSISLPNLFVPGANVVAVEVHQGNASSSDLSFNLALRGEYRAPTVTLISPADLTVLPDPTVPFTVGADDLTGLASATLVVAAPPQTLTFSGPTETVDAEIRQTEPDANFGSQLSVNVDGQNPHAHALLQFPAIVGPQPGQLPTGTQISSALLRVYCANPGNPLRIFRLTESWSENETTWNERSHGLPWSAPGADGLASHAAEGLPGDCSAIGWRTLDLTAIVQAWTDGAANHGCVLIDSGTDGVDFESSESGTPPELVITYGGETLYSEQQTLAGTSATIHFSVTLTGDSDYLWNCEVENTAGLRSWAAASHRLTLDSHYPAVPALVHPADGATATSLSPPLTANVTDPDNDPMDVTFYGRGGNLSAGEFTIVFLPDTQKYVINPAYAPIFTAQTQWIVDQREALNIVFVTHAGDICDTYNSVSEHAYAAQSLSRLDGVVPYGLLPGNHDQPTTLYNTYWPYIQYQYEPWYGGHYPANGNDNSFQRFSAGGVDFLIVHLQFAPGADVIAWADAVLKAHPNHKAILTTHGFLDIDGDRNVEVMGSTQYIWDGLVVPNDNVLFVLCGHMHGEYTRTDIVNGRPVHQLLADYQNYPEGGQGWLRVMRFVPADNTVYVHTYSPHLNSYQTDADSAFRLDFPMNGFAPLGTMAAVPSGMNAQGVWTDLEPNTAYEWYVSATDVTGRTTFSPVWHFTTGTGDIPPPTIPPQANAQSVVLNEDQSTEILLTASDPDTPAEDLVFTVATGPGSGVLSGAAPNLTYTPNANFNGADQFQFTVSDGTTVSAPAPVTLTITPVNDPPVADGMAATVAEDGSLVLTLTGSDLDSPSLTFQVQANPAHGALTGSAPNLVYAPNADYFGPDSLTFTTFDGELSSAPATVTLHVTPVNDPPLAQGQTFQTQEDTDLIVTLTGSDVDGDLLTFAVLTPPEHGTLSGTAPDLVYSPDTGYFGPDSFTFVARDGTSDSAPATVQITVTQFDNPPVADAGPDVSAYTGETVLFDGSASSDPDGTIVSYAWDFGDGSPPTAGASVSHVYTVPGIYTVTLTVTDNDGATATDTSIVTVTAPLLEVEVFYDSFEVSEWNGLWTEDTQNDWFRSTQRATNGSRSAEVDGSASNASLTSIPIGLQGRSNARITFDWLIESGLDKGEYIDFRVSTNGGSGWTQKAILRGNVDSEDTWHPVAVELTGISQLRLQFRGKMSDSSEDANVDNVKVVAY